MPIYNDIATIIVSVERNDEGMPIKYTFEWWGESPFVVISKQFLNETNTYRLDAITFGGFNLLRVRDRGDDILYIREDVTE